MIRRLKKNLVLLSMRSAKTADDLLFGLFDQRQIQVLGGRGQWRTVGGAGADHVAGRPATPGRLAFHKKPGGGGDLISHRRRCFAGGNRSGQSRRADYTRQASPARRWRRRPFQTMEGAAAAVGDDDPTSTPRAAAR